MISCYCLFFCCIKSNFFFPFDLKHNLYVILGTGFSLFLSHLCLLCLSVLLLLPLFYLSYLISVGLSVYLSLITEPLPLDHKAVNVIVHPCPPPSFPPSLTLMVAVIGHHQHTVQTIKWVIFLTGGLTCNDVGSRPMRRDDSVFRIITPRSQWWMTKPFLPFSLHFPQRDHFSARLNYLLLFIYALLLSLYHILLHFITSEQHFFERVCVCVCVFHCVCLYLCVKGVFVSHGKWKSPETAISSTT